VSALEAHDANGIGAEEEAARLFQAHSEEVLALCRRQLGSSSDADDALQTTFLYVLRALQRGVVPEREAAWLTTIAKNVCHSQRRTLVRRGPLATDLDLDRVALAQPESGERELVAALPAALATLPDSQRKAIVMREWLGLAPGEIASRLELTTTATNALLTRARHSLAIALTAAVRRPLSALNVGVLAEMLRGYLKTLLGSAASKTAVAAVAATASVGGVVAQQSLGDGRSAGKSPPIADRERRADATAAREPNPSPQRAIGVAARPRASVLAADGKVAASTRPDETTVEFVRPKHEEGLVAPLEPDTPSSPEASSPKTTERDPVSDAGGGTPIPGLPPLPDPPVVDPPIPPVELPPLPPLPEQPVVEPPPLPPLP
jgi:RNA polymerase sigma factor (sigma-70 family)